MEDLVKLVYTHEEYKHVLTVLGNLSSDFRDETFTRANLCYVANSLEVARSNYKKYIEKGEDQNEAEFRSVHAEHDR